MNATNNRNELAADTANGVYVCENPTSSQQKQEHIDVLQDEDFLLALATVKDGQTIYGNVSDEIAERIDDEYGIH